MPLDGRVLCKPDTLSARRIVMQLLDGEPTEELIALHQEEGVAVPPESAAEPYDETLRRSLRQHYRSKPTGLPV